MGEIFTGTLRQADMVGRIGGEEFVIILPGTSAQAAVPLVERLRETIAAAQWPGTQLKQVTVSIGIASHSPGQDDRLLMLDADKALYKAKRDGRNLLRVAA
jgi:diguanylate cyclase (GGDEF)-like protein